MPPDPLHLPGTARQYHTCSPPPHNKTSSYTPFLVQKKDGSLRFCLELNSVTKADMYTFPLPRIDDLLDQLGKAKHFSNSILHQAFGKSGCIPDPSRRQHSQFHKGCTSSESFWPMPLDWPNKYSMGLNPESVLSITAYIDYILVFS